MKNRVAMPWGILLLGLLSGQASSQDPKDPVVDGQPLSYWIKQLGSEKAEDRFQAVAHLLRGARLPAAKVAVPALIVALRDRDVRVRKMAAETIELIGPAAREAEPALRKLVTKDEPACAAAAAALAGIGVETKTAAPVVIDFIKRTDKKDIYKRQEGYDAIDLLPRLKDAAPEVVPFLMECLADDYWGRCSIWALGRIGPPAKAAVPLLVKKLKHPIRDIGKEALEAMAKMGPEGVEGVIQALTIEELAHDACTLLASMGKEAKAAVPALIRLVNESKHPAYSAVHALGQIGPDAKDAIPSLIKFMARTPPDYREDSPYPHVSIPAVALSKIDLYAEGVVPAIVEAMKERKSRFDLLALLKSGGPKIAPHMIPVLKHPDGLVRTEAAAILAGIGPEAIPTLERGLKDDNHLVRVGSLEALRRMGPRAASTVPAIVKALKDDEPKVRSAAASALQFMGREARVALPALCEALKDDDPRTRQMSAYSLGKLGVESKEAAPALTKALKDREPNVRTAAIHGLRTLRADSDEAVTGLGEAVGDAVPGVRLPAISTLAQLGPKARAAVPALTRAVKDDDPQVRAAAITTLGDIGPAAESSVPTLRDALKDKDPSVRVRVLPALKKIIGETK